MKKSLASLPLTALYLFLLAGCSKIGVILNKYTSEKQMTSFSVISGRDTIKMNIMDSTIEGLQLDTLKKDNIVALFSFRGRKVHIAGVPQSSGSSVNNFTTAVTYVVEAEDGSMKSYKVKVRSFTGLPIIYPKSPPVVSKDIYVDGTMKVNGNLDYPDNVYSMQIKGRGNSTWFTPKKPYKIKLSDKSSLLSLPADKEWALLANYYDKSLIRNDMAFELSERLERKWTPKRRFVEVFMNGNSEGNYLFTETIKSGKTRVNIDLNNGGYLLEANAKPQEDDQRFYSNTWGNDIPFDIKEGILPLSNIKAQVDALMFKIDHNDFNPLTGYQADFDLDAFVSWYLVNEIIINNDATFYSSVFLQKENATSKLEMGPVWDFDLSSGNVNYGQIDPTGWYLKQSAFIQNLWTDPLFHAAVKAKWNKYRTQIFSLPEYISQKQLYITNSAFNNFTRWDILNVPLINTVRIFGSFPGEVDYLHSFMIKRIEWIDKEINR